jgi:hypothetical protein
LEEPCEELIIINRIGRLSLYNGTGLRLSWRTILRSYYETAKSAVKHSIERHRLKLPTDGPVMRITFDREPGWELLGLLRAFDHDAYPIFGQALKITDAYYGCFEADFEPSDGTPEPLEHIAKQVLEPSDFDDLIAKYRIVSIELFNFPGRKHVMVNYTEGQSQTARVAD